MSDIATMTPVEIDTILADLWTKAYNARQAYLRQWNEMKEWVGRELDPKAGYRARKALNEEVDEYLATLPATGRTYNESAIARMHERYEALCAEADKWEHEAAPYEDEFTRRGGWTRAYLVTSSSGHVHRSMACSTCYADTQFHWLPTYSGKDESEIVEDAGERACTVCYPSAPVDVLKRPTKIFSEDEKAAQKAREERAAKKAEREAAQIAVEGWSDYGDRTSTKVFKSERAVRNAIASEAKSLAWYGLTHPTAPRWNMNIVKGVDALLAKGFEASEEEVLEKARKAVKREGGTPKI